MVELDAGHRLLKLLAANPVGCNKFLLLAHGFSPELIADLVKAGLAVTDTHTMRPVEVTMVRITDAGRVVLER